MVRINPAVFSKFLPLFIGFSGNHAFVPPSYTGRGGITAQLLAETITFETTDSRTGKPTGTSFLPAEAIDRASKGNPIEKAKLAKDGTSAFVDVYEYAAKIREGKMTWEEVEAADLNTVRV
jgi:ferredoxin-nitrite reductase